MTLVCLDTCIVILGVLKEKSDPDQQILVDRSTALLKLIEKNRDSVVLPSIVVGQFLVHISREEHGEVLARLDRNWMIADFDIRAARQFAQMRHGRSTAEDLKELQKTNPSATRQELFADTMIAATAIVNGATKVYTRDKGFVTMAKHYKCIKVINLDNMTFPLEQVDMNLPEANEAGESNADE